MVTPPWPRSRTARSNSARADMTIFPRRPEQSAAESRTPRLTPCAPRLAPRASRLALQAPAQQHGPDGEPRADRTEQHEIALLQASLEPRVGQGEWNRAGG